MTSPRPVLLWFRLDLRLNDNPAVAAALRRGGPVLPVYIVDPVEEGATSPGAASRWWLHHSLQALAADLSQRGARLIVRRGESAAVLKELRDAVGADALYFNRRYEPSARANEAAVMGSWGQAGLPVHRFNASLLHEPETVKNRQGGPYQVFTPFWRDCVTREVTDPTQIGKKSWPAPARAADSLEIDQLRLLPTLNWAEQFPTLWTPGEAGGRAALRRFVQRTIADYDRSRDRPAEAGTSQLSPHLHFGEVGPRQVWQAVKGLSETSGVFPPHNGARVFLAELGWREFAYHQLYHFPDTVTRPKRAEFERFEWRQDPGSRLLHAWQRGRTGYPIVDAGLRQLWATGWMHNRVRMIVASFLVKHLRLPWQLGVEWFSDTLVDADVANNTLGWQWVAGCGADAAPFFRIFNPMTQGARFDPEGNYVKQWVPELRGLPPEQLHAPWEADPDVLTAAGVRLGETYPLPIVDHATARLDALAAYRKLRSVS